MSETAGEKPFHPEIERWLQEHPMDVEEALAVLSASPVACACAGIITAGIPRVPYDSAYDTACECSLKSERALRTALASLRLHGRITREMVDALRLFAQSTAHCPGSETNASFEVVGPVVVFGAALNDEQIRVLSKYPETFAALADLLESLLPPRETEA